MTATRNDQNHSIFTLAETAPSTHDNAVRARLQWIGLLIRVLTGELYTAQVRNVLDPEMQKLTRSNRDGVGSIDSE